MRRAGLAVALAALACAAPAGAHTYGGKTVRDGQISFRIGADSSTVVLLSAERELTCRRGRVKSFRSGTFRQARRFVRRRGRLFRGSIRTRGPRGSLVRRGRFAIRFVVRSEVVAAGVFRERLRLKDGTRCTSGRVRFRLPLTDTND
jgi:hypothetical protein